MKRLSTFWLTTLLLLGALASCADETKEIVGVDIVEDYDIRFEIKDETLTSTTYSFEIIPTDKQTPYVCLYVDKSVIDKVPKQDLPSFLLGELQKNASASSKTWDEYLASISLKGDAKRTITNLLPGNIYELVVFGVRGGQLSRQATYQFFETLKADNVDMTFEVQVDASRPTKAVLDVKPSLKEVKWYLCSFPKATYERVKASGMSDEQIALSYLGEEIRSFFQFNPNATPEAIDAFINSKFFTGDQEITIQGRSMKADTEYVYLIIAAHITASKEVVFISQATRGEYTTAKVAQKDTSFTLKVDNIRQTRAAVTVEPSDPTQRYVWRCGAHNEATLRMTPDEHAKYIINTNPYIFFEAQPHRTVSYPDYKLTPSTKHFLIAFGYEGGVCTQVYKTEFDPLTAGDPTKTDFTVDIAFRSTDRIQLNIKPSDPSVLYIPLLYPDTESKESIKGRLIASIRRTLDQTRAGGFNPDATLWDIINQMADLGDSQPEWTSSLTPGGKYTLMILTFDKEGIAAERLFTPSYLTVPSLSTETVDGAEIAGIFDGNEENGQVFGQPGLVKDKVIMVIKYRLSQGITEPYAAANEDQANVDELDPNVLPDAQILRNAGLQWAKMKRTVSYMFLLAKWDTPQISYSYGYNKDMERGPIARAQIRAVTINEKEPIDKLRKLYDEANTAPATRITSVLWTPQPPVAIEAYMPTPSKQAEYVPAPLRSAIKGSTMPDEHDADITIPLVHAVR